MAEEFEQEAKKAKGDQKIFTKKMPWIVGEEGTLSVLYSDGKSTLRLGISKLSGNGTVQTYMTAQTKAEKIKINDREVIFHDESKSEKNRPKYMAVWYDEKNKYSYSLLGMNGNGLSKEDFLDSLEALVARP